MDRKTPIEQQVEELKCVCGNCFDFGGGKCRIRKVMINGKWKPRKVKKTTKGCEVFMFKN